MVETGVIASSGKADNGVVGLKTLDKNITVLMATIGTTNNLSDQFISAFFGSIVGQAKSGIGLNNAERAESRKIKTFGNRLGADKKIIIASMNGCINLVKLLVRFSVGIETGDAGMREESTKLGFNEFGAEAFVMNSGIATIGAGGGDGIMTTASVAAHSVLVGMKNKREETIGTEGLPATMVADGEGRGAATVMEN